MSKAGQRLCVAIATGFHLSYIPVWLHERVPFMKRGPMRWTGAGLVGALLGWAALPLLPQGGPVRVCTALAAVILAACAVCTVAEQSLGMHDDPRIILDETVGFWTAAAFHPRGLWPMLGALVLFRLFDSLKPWPVRRLEALPGGLGVVIDDAAAGLLANLALRLILCAWPAAA